MPCMPSSAGRVVKRAVNLFTPEVRVGWLYLRVRLISVMEFNKLLKKVYARARFPRRRCGCSFNFVTFDASISVSNVSSVRV